MIHSWKPYAILSVIFLGSLLFFAIQFYLPLQNSILRDIIHFITSLPVWGSLCFGIYQLHRDRVAFDRDQELQKKEQFYNLSVTSHMAEVAFNKHVEFCEKYIKGLDHSLQQAFIHGPSGDTLNSMARLAEIRMEYRPWITKDIQEKIIPFEDTLRKIGAIAVGLEGITIGERRTIEVKKMHDEWGKLTGVGLKNTEDEGFFHEKIVEYLQGLLGIEELSKLRENIIKQAIKSL